jgi:hypothetical protein
VEGKTMLRCAAFALLLVVAAQAQESSLTARRLFYGENPQAAAPARPAETPKPRPAGPAQSQAKKADNRKPAPAEVPQPKVEVAAGAPSRNSTAGSSPNSAPVVPAALHLGLRYNVVKVNAGTGEKSYVDPDSAFHQGDCVAVEFETNRSGYVYVFNHGSTGAWTPLIPVTPGEAARVSRGQTARVPADGCFKFDDNPGQERLLFVITELENDHDSLRRAMEREKSPSQQPSLLAENRLGPQLDEFRNAALVRRDLTVEKVSTAQGPNEAPGAVYVVRTVANDRDRIVFEVPLRHD